MTQNEIEPNDSSLPPSKRAARRIIQRAFVLTGRDKQFRQHIREVRLTTLWALEDWELIWTVIINRGKIEFERRPTKHPDLTLSWPTADEFFVCAREAAPSNRRLELEATPDVPAGCRQPAQDLFQVSRSRAS